MIIDEERPRDLSYPPPVSAPAPMSSKRREALGLGLGASLPPAATVTPLAPRKGRAYNGPTNRAYEHRPSPPSLSSPPYSTVTLQSSSQSTTSSTLYPPSHSYSPRPAQAPLHSVAEPTLGAITPNPLLFRNDVVLPDARSPPPSRPGGVTPNLLLLPNSEFAKSQPPGMIGNMYPTTAPPVVQAPRMLSLSNLLDLT
jgi:hypothetical protein